MGLYIYFGVPGSGKSTLAARIAFKNHKKGIRTFSNFPLSYTYQYSVKDDIGKYLIWDCDIILDEASIDYNNRLSVSRSKEVSPMNQDAIKFWKYYRHYGVRNVYIFSQSYDDMDITLRRLADELFICHRFFFGLFFYQRIVKHIEIDPNTHQIIDGYLLNRFPHFYIGRRYWKYFDSFSVPPLPVRNFDYIDFSV